jgi:hypothetical protein
MQVFLRRQRSSSSFQHAAVCAVAVEVIAPTAVVLTTDLQRAGAIPSERGEVDDAFARLRQEHACLRRPLEGAISELGDACAAAALAALAG